MKRIVGFLIVISLTVVLSLNSFAVQQENSDNSEESLTDVFFEMLESEKTEISEEPDETETENKAEPCTATIDMDFSENEILVVMTKEQSRQKQQYTKNDFNELDIERIDINIDYYPDLDNNLHLCITLNESNKQKVLDSIKILEEYENVYSASPNYIYQIEDIPVEDSPPAAIPYGAYVPYTQNQLLLEHNANYFTFSCCAKKYTDPNKNRKSKIGIVGHGIDSTCDASSKVIEYVNCTKKMFKKSILHRIARIHLM